VRQLRAKLIKPALTDDFGRTKILELGRVSARFSTEADKEFCAFEIPIMVGRNVGDEIGGVLQSNLFLS
jgi:hypothetical protein